MKSIKIVLLSVGLLALDVAWGEQTESLEQLLGRIEEVPDGEASISRREVAYCDNVSAHGDEAVPHLVKLLAHPNEDVAEIAAYALGSCKHIDEKYLPEIMVGLDREIGWLPNALGKIDSDLAAEEAVKRFLVSDSAPHNQEANAVRRHGRRAIPFIIHAAKSDNSQTSNVHYLLGYILGEMGEAERSYAAKALIEIAMNTQSSLELRGEIIGMIGYLDEAGLVVEDELLELRKSKPGIRDRIDSVLVGIRSTHSGQIFSEVLKQGADPHVLGTIARTGAAAHDAGEEVLKLLDHSDWEMRRVAARTLGFIGYDKAAPQLIPLLSEPSDVKLNLIAVESLGRLRAILAVKPLSTIAKEHWHPVVRKNAEEALLHIQTAAPYESKYHPNNFFFEFRKYEHFGMEGSAPGNLVFKQEPPSDKLYGKTSPDALKKLSYQSEIISYGACDEEEQIAEKGEGSIIVVNENNIVEHKRSITQIPGVALHVDGGWIVGSSRGEWGGELVFIGDDGTQTNILKANVHDLYTLGTRKIAITGLAHLMSNCGMILELSRGDDLQWTASPWRVLPGAPDTVGMLESGKIFIETNSGGNIILSEDGSFRMADDMEL